MSSTWPIPDHITNIGDLISEFWRRYYVVTASEFGPIFLVNADCEGEAFDWVIDWIEDCGKMPGLLIDRDKEAEEEFLEEYIQGGNHGRYLSSINATCREITKAEALEYARQLLKYQCDKCKRPMVGKYPDDTCSCGGSIEAVPKKEVE